MINSIISNIIRTQTQYYIRLGNLIAKITDSLLFSFYSSIRQEMTSSNWRGGQTEYLLPSNRLQIQ